MTRRKPNDSVVDVEFKQDFYWFIWDGEIFYSKFADQIHLYQSALFGKIKASKALYPEVYREICVKKYWNENFSGMYIVEVEGYAVLILDSEKEIKLKK